MFLLVEGWTLRREKKKLKIQDLSHGITITKSVSIMDWFFCDSYKVFCCYIFHDAT